MDPKTQNVAIWIKKQIPEPRQDLATRCGRSGDMLVCPKCHAQKDFILKILN